MDSIIPGAKWNSFTMSLNIIIYYTVYFCSSVVKFWVRPVFSNSQILTVASSEQDASKFVWKGEKRKSQTLALCPVINFWSRLTLTGVLASITAINPPPVDVHEQAKKWVLASTNLPSVVISQGLTSSNFSFHTSPKIYC